MASPRRLQRSVDRELGELTERVDTLSREFKQGRDELAQELQREREATVLHRDGLNQILQSLGEAVRAQTKEITEMKPLVMDYREHRAEKRGAASVKKWLLGTVVSVSTIIGAVLNEIWKFLAHLK